MKRKRNHKEVLRRRQSKQKDKDKVTKERILTEIANEYIAGAEVFPLPTLVDGLSAQDINKIKPIQVGIKSVIKDFDRSIQKRVKEFNLSINLPKHVHSFIIPLDFYIPLPEPYNAMNIVLSQDTVTAAKCVTVVSDVVRLGDSAVKASYLIVSLCIQYSTEADKPKDFNHKKLFDVAIAECNHVITAFQAIPSRHNHYMHRITDKSCANTINTFTFDRYIGKITDRRCIIVNYNTDSEIFQARALNEKELQQFIIAHTDKSFTKDKVFDLVSKYNDAINARCFGNYDQSILLSDSYTELTIGYILCEIQKSIGMDPGEVSTQYSEYRDSGSIIKKLAELLGTSRTQLRNSIDHDNWYKYCHEIRNDLTHRWLTDIPSAEDSLHALYYSGELISKLCQLVQNKYPQEQYPELYDKLSLLMSASYITKKLHTGMG